MNTQLVKSSIKKQIKKVDKRGISARVYRKIKKTDKRIFLKMAILLFVVGINLTPSVEIDIMNDINVDWKNVVQAFKGYSTSHFN